MLEYEQSDLATMSLKEAVHTGVGGGAGDDALSKRAPIQHKRNRLLAFFTTGPEKLGAKRSTYVCIDLFYVMNTLYTNLAFVHYISIQSTAIVCT